MIITYKNLIHPLNIGYIGISLLDLIKYTLLIIVVKQKKKIDLLSLYGQFQKTKHSSCIHIQINLLYIDDIVYVHFKVQICFNISTTSSSYSKYAI